MALWGKTDTDAAKPKYLSDTLRNDQQVSDLDSTVGVSVTEAQAAANIAKGIKTPGWTLYRTYTDAQGNVRNKAEVLVAMNQFAADGSDNDNLAPEITISGQPSNTSVVSGATGSFSVTATRTGTGSLTYQWQKQEGGAGAWSNITGATSNTYTTGALTVAADNSDKYRVIVSLTGADSITSNAATLTVTAAVITIGTQPTNQTAVEGETATFVSAATATGGATVAYQWEVSTDDGATWTAVTGATSASYTTDTLVVGQDGNQYRVVVSANKEATPVTSSVATLTVNAAG